MTTLTALKSEFTNITDVKAEAYLVRYYCTKHGITLEGNLNSVDTWEVLLDSVKQHKILLGTPITYTDIAKYHIPTEKEHRIQKESYKEHIPTKDLKPIGYTPKTDKPEYVSIVDVDPNSTIGNIVECNLDRAREQALNHLGKHSKKDDSRKIVKVKCESEKRIPYALACNLSDKPIPYFDGKDSYNSQLQMTVRLCSLTDKPALKIVNGQWMQYIHEKIEVITNIRAGFSQLEYYSQLGNDKAASNFNTKPNNYLSVWESLCQLSYKDTNNDTWHMRKLLSNLGYNKDSDFNEMFSLPYLTSPMQMVTSLLLYGGYEFNLDNQLQHELELQAEYTDSEGVEHSAVTEYVTSTELITRLVWRGKPSPIVAIGNEDTGILPYYINVTSRISNALPLPSNFLSDSLESPNKAIKSSFVKGRGHDRYSSGETDTNQEISQLYKNVEVRLKLNDTRNSTLLATVEYRLIDGTIHRDKWFTIGMVNIQTSKKGSVFLGFNDADTKPLAKLIEKSVSGNEVHYYNDLLIALTGLLGQSKVGQIRVKPESRWVNPEWQARNLKVKLSHTESHGLTPILDRRCRTK